MRLRIVQPDAAGRERETDTRIAAPLRIVTMIGETIARSGALSNSHLGGAASALHVAGFRGRHGLGLFVGTKLLLVIGLPLLTADAAMAAARTICRIRPLLLAIAAGIGLLAPDKVVQHLRAPPARSGKRAYPTRWT